MLDNDGNVTQNAQEMVREQFIYRIGAIKVDDDWNLTGISEKPILEKSHFPEDEAPGLRNDKVVVYVCDTPQIGPDGITRFIAAAGDTAAFSVALPEGYLDARITPIEALSQNEDLLKEAA